MYATVFGNMVAIVQRLYSKASRFHSEMNIIKEFLKFYKIPEDLRRSIQTYVRQAWTFSEGVDVEKVILKRSMFHVIIFWHCHMDLNGIHKTLLLTVKVNRTLSYIIRLTGIHLKF